MTGTVGRPEGGAFVAFFPPRVVEDTCPGQQVGRLLAQFLRRRPVVSRLQGLEAGGQQ